MPIIHFLRSKLIKLLPGLTMKYRRFKNWIYQKLPPKKTKFGFFFVGNSDMMNGKFEYTETKIINSILNKTDCFINIGANYGYYVCLSLQKGIKTIAFEPVKSNIDILKKNLAINNFQNMIELYPIALSDKVGFEKIYGTGTSASFIKGWASNTDEYSQIVETNTLDNLLKDKFLNEKILIIIDVEGFEFNILNGAKEFIRRKNKPIWFIEISLLEHLPQNIEKNPYFLETFKLFWNHGYKSYMANEDLTEIDIILADKAFNTNKEILKCHNFIFIDKEVNIKELINL